MNIPITRSVFVRRRESPSGTAGLFVSQSTVVNKPLYRTLTLCIIYYAFLVVFIAFVTSYMCKFPRFFQYQPISSRQLKLVDSDGLIFSTDWHYNIETDKIRRFVDDARSSILLHDGWKSNYGLSHVNQSRRYNRYVFIWIELYITVPWRT